MLGNRRPNPHNPLAMTHVLTLAHISDLHLTPVTGLAPRHWNVKRGLGYLNWVKNRRPLHRRAVADRLAADLWAHGADHVAVTGDVANLGLPGEFVEARRWLEALGPPDRVSAIPGNHDIYTRLRPGATCLDAWDAYLASDAWGRALVAPQEPVFPSVRRLGPLALIGLNSAIPTRPFIAAGRLGAAQLTALDRLLSDDRLRALKRVVMIHHPPLPRQTAPRRALQDAEDLAAVLTARGADLVIHGHNHQDSLIWHPGPAAPIPVVGVASGSAVRAHGREPPARYNLYRWNADTPAIELMVRGLGGEDGCVVELSRQTLTPP